MNKSIKFLSIILLVIVSLLITPASIYADTQAEVMEAGACEYYDSVCCMNAIGGCSTSSDCTTCGGSWAETGGDIGAGGSATYSCGNCMDVSCSGNWESATGTCPTGKYCCKPKTLNSCTAGYQNIVNCDTETNPTLLNACCYREYVYQGAYLCVPPTTGCIPPWEPANNPNMCGSGSGCSPDTDDVCCYKDTGYYTPYEQKGCSEVSAANCNTCCAPCIGDNNANTYNCAGCTSYTGNCAKCCKQVLVPGDPMYSCEFNVNCKPPKSPVDDSYCYGMCEYPEVCCRETELVYAYEKLACNKINVAPSECSTCCASCTKNSIYPCSDCTSLTGNCAKCCYAQTMYYETTYDCMVKCSGGWSRADASYCTELSCLEFQECCSYTLTRTEYYQKDCNYLDPTTDCSTCCATCGTEGQVCCSDGSLCRDAGLYPSYGKDDTKQTGEQGYCCYTKDYWGGTRCTGGGEQCTSLGYCGGSTCNPFTSLPWLCTVSDCEDFYNQAGNYACCPNVDRYGEIDKNYFVPITVY